MKREDIQKIEGLSKEQIESILNLHQVDVTDWNKKLQDKAVELSAKDTKITELTENVKKFDGVDVKKLQDDVRSWEKKYSDDLMAEKKNSAIKLAITQSKARNEKALLALLDMDIIKVNGDGLVTGLKEQLENVKKDSPYLFEEETPKPEEVNLGGGHEDSSGKEVTWDSALDEAWAK